MGMSEYTDYERMKIAQKEYPEYNNGKPLQVGKPVKINDYKTTIGYVAKAIHNDDTGEDSYVITNTKDASKATKVTVLYQGTTDWVDLMQNDIPIGADILDVDSDGRSVPTAQLKSSAQTLQKAFDDYPNAHFEVYGQSLGAMVGQFALVS